MNLTPEQRKIGKDNFYSAVGSDLTRREFLAGSLAAAAVSGVGLGSFYFGYKKLSGDPVRVGMIGTGDEGGVLIGQHTPDYLNIVAIADIRPYNVHRALHGDQSSPSVAAIRTGLMKKYGWKSDDEARKKLKIYDKDYHDLLKDPAIEAVIIALPLHMHDVVAIEAMRAGKHVLTEKLMAHSVHQAKEMGRVSKQTKMLLATGHQRHYSILYDNAVDMIKRDLLGDVHSIRAQWHRGNLPGHDSWSPPLPEDLEKDLAKVEQELNSPTLKSERLDALSKRKRLLELQVLDKYVDAAKYGYEEKKLEEIGRVRTPLEELIRWRIWDRTGGGLMAELGSHQLDASGIFISAKAGKHVRPLSVNAMGGRYVFPADRDCDDHVYCMFEYPGPDYEKDKNSKVGVAYSSINGNGYGGYGEVVMGTKGTLILEREQEIMMFAGANTATSVSVAKKKGKDELVLDTTASGPPAATDLGKRALDGPVSKGYTEEMEHWAWCIRNYDYEHNQPRCKPEVAMGDAIVALTSNLAIRQNKRIEFKPEWFDIDSDETPEGVKPSIKV